MDLSPSLEAFERLAEDHRVVPVWREFLFDVDTAVTAYAKLAEPPFGFLLESVEGGEQWARYTFLGTRPAAGWRLRGDRVDWWTPAGGWEPVDCDDPMEDLRRRLEERNAPEIQGLPRLWGGAVGFFAYDIVRQFERLPDPPPDDLDLPDGLFVFTDIVLAIDNLLGRARAVASVEVPAGADSEDVRARYDAAGARIDDVIERLRRGVAPPPLSVPDEPESDPAFSSSMERAAFEEAVDRAKEHIRAGDVFQVVLSQRLSMELDAPPFDLYRVLRSVNPSPYLYFLELDGLTLIGSSPEVLVRVEGGTVTVRPIAGTRPRGADPEADRVMARDLLSDEKELAEHRMLVDLGRNDVGRVADFGSVSVVDLMVVERYSHVLHMVSQVEGTLKPGLGSVDVLRACFPAGTVSGAPKIRAMEIIDELEPVRRGPYAGAVGHLGYGGTTMDTAITIRTVVVTDGNAYVQAGAGIVVDSDPAREYDETLNKARALLRAGAMASGAGRRQVDSSS
jgi:anthranilate synthase component 1